MGDGSNALGSRPLSRGSGTSLNSSAANAFGGQADPFYSAKERVSDRISRISSDFHKWQQRVLNPAMGSAATPDDETVPNLRVALKRVGSDVNDLSDTITIVVKNRNRFAHISDQELENRKTFVKEVRAVIDEYTQTINQHSQKFEAAGAGKRSFATSNTRRAFDREFGREQEDFVASRGDQQQLLQQKEDEVLDDMISALGRLGDVSNTISDTIKEQKRDLDELDTHVEEGNSRMDVVMKKVNRLLGSSDKGRICCIIFLAIMIIVLILLLFYA